MHYQQRYEAKHILFSDGNTNAVSTKDLLIQLLVTHLPGFNLPGSSHLQYVSITGLYKIHKGLV